MLSNVRLDIVDKVWFVWELFQRDIDWDRIETKFIYKNIRALRL